GQRQSSGMFAERVEEGLVDPFWISQLDDEFATRGMGLQQKAEAGQKYLLGDVPSSKAWKLKQHGSELVTKTADGFQKLSEFRLPVLHLLLVGDDLRNFQCKEEMGGSTIPPVCDG